MCYGVSTTDQMLLIFGTLITLLLQTFQPDVFTIQAKQLGPFRIGGSVYDVFEYYKNSSKGFEKIVRVKPLEGVQVPPFEIYPDAKNLSFIVFGIPEEGVSNDIILAIKIVDSCYKTGKGLGVGSTLKEFQEAYPGEVFPGELGGEPYTATVSADLHIELELKPNRTLQRINREGSKTDFSDAVVVSITIR